MEADFGVFEDSFFEDLDFEYLYDDAYDGIETADVAAVMGITNLAFGEWFEPFAGAEESDFTKVHPYTGRPMHLTPMAMPTPTSHNECGTRAQQCRYVAAAKSAAKPSTGTRCNGTQ